MPLFAKASSLQQNSDNINASTDLMTGPNPNANDLEAQRVVLIPASEARPTMPQLTQTSSTTPAADYGTIPGDSGDGRRAAVPVAAVMTDSVLEPETDYWSLFLGLVVLGAFAMLLYGGSRSWRG